jgi:hypothetical protein
MFMIANAVGYRQVSFGLLVCCLIWSAMPVARASSPGDKDKMTAEEVVAKHLAALGTPEKRAEVKTVVAVGKSNSTIKIGGSGTLEGAVVMASSGNRNLVGIDYPQSNYRTERMAFDGKKVTLGQITPGKYSEIALYFKTYELPLRDGTLGGVLSTAWPLLNLAGGKGKVKFNGNKKVDGRDAYVLRYEGKNNNGLVISMFFDVETFRHVRTEYERRQNAYGVSQPGVTQQATESVIKLTEQFADFAQEGGLDLPHTYKLELSENGYLQNWTISLGSFVFNKEIGEDQFDASGVTK